MRVFLLKDVEKVGLSGEIVKVGDGYARNFIVPRKMGIVITNENEATYEKKARTVDNRKEAVSSKSSMLAERIKEMRLTLKRKMHDGGKLYGSIGQTEVADLLALEGVTVAKNRIIFDKSIKSKGSYDVTVKLTSTLQPTFKLVIVAESSEVAE